MKLAITADIHANLEAFSQVLNDCALKRVDKILTAGDMVNYNANPVEVLDMLQEHHVISIAGNHDRVCSTLQDIKKLNEYAQKSAIWTNRKLSPEHKRFLDSLPDIKTLTIEQLQVVMIHGSPSNHCWDYVFPTASESILQGYLEQTQADILIFGHTHLPVLKSINGKWIINPGSVGQPRDNSPFTSYVLFDTATMRPQLVRLPYDVQRTAAKILSSGLPRFLAERLFLGR